MGSLACTFFISRDFFVLDNLYKYRRGSIIFEIVFQLFTDTIF